jgi:2-polyprenyl-3-methyl-5-hydroxy-6-metoxy-1,4-benzoquinol methylase
MKSGSEEHWQSTYLNKKPNEVSWFQELPAVSLNLIEETNLSHDQSIVDIGGGASTLVDKLLDKGFKDLTVVDISEQALDYAKERLGDNAQNINWIAADITEYEFQQQYDLWHDRAVFHFLTDPNVRVKYKEALEQALTINGYLIIATFALDGPSKCSGLEVEHYDAKKLQVELGSNFTLLHSVNESHLTPWGAEQKFVYCLFKKSKIQCPLCNGEATKFYREEFYLCSNCLGIFLRQDLLPNREQEKKRYQLHNNDVFDAGYRSFVQPITQAILERFTPDDQGLDFGSGATSAVSAILKEKNFQIQQYDPFFHNYPEFLENKYDYIVCCEVVEHFHKPAREFTLLKNLLKPNGCLFGMTEIYNPKIDFATWYYKNDNTHVFFYQKESLEWIRLELGFSSLECSDRLFVLESSNLHHLLEEKDLCK